MITYEWIFGGENLKDVHDVRYVVFVEEQAVPIEEEVIAWEDETSWHLMIYSDGKPAATGRVLLHEGKHILQRIAVLKEFRGQGLGALVTKKLIEKAEGLGAKEVSLSSQAHAVGLYEKLGFAICSEMYMDAGIEHFSMTKTLA